MANEILQPTDQDWQMLLNGNPLAAAELKAIILNRILSERNAEIAALKAEGEPENVTDINETKAD